MFQVYAEAVHDLHVLGVHVPARVVCRTDKLRVAACGDLIIIPHLHRARTLTPRLREGLRRTLVHELGHVWLYHNWGRCMRAGFARVFGSPDAHYPRGVGWLVRWARCRKKKAYISRYATYHPLEDWAETFEYVIRCGLRPRRVHNPELQSKLDFMVRALSRC